MDTNKEVRNDELKVAMITLKLQDDKESEDIFIEALKKAYFLIPSIDDHKKDELTFMLLCDQNNNNYFQAYTDEEEYNKWPDSINSKSFILTFDEYANIVINSDEEVKGLVLNPFTQNIILDKDFLNKIFTMDKIYIDEVSKCPTEIQKLIKNVLIEKKEINKAYLMNMKKKNIPGYLLIIDSDIKNKKKLYEEIGNEIIKNIEQINIDIISSKDNFVQDIIKGKKAFYTKKLK